MRVRIGALPTPALGFETSRRIIVDGRWSRVPARAWAFRVGTDVILGISTDLEKVAPSAGVVATLRMKHEVDPNFSGTGSELSRGYVAAGGDKKDFLSAVLDLDPLPDLPIDKWMLACAPWEEPSCPEEHAFWAVVPDVPVDRPGELSGWLATMRRGDAVTSTWDTWLSASSWCSAAVPWREGKPSGVGWPSASREGLT